MNLSVWSHCHPCAPGWNSHVVRYTYEISDSYASAIFEKFIPVDDSARSHRARLIEVYLQDHGLERIGWPAQFSDLNPLSV
ncbi:hypothetical protein AVEN_193368-1 [Araneus ventricosus]|uniref:Uncharacterized protein n=1 Tax=Araneus ventricosus TaxID=182803 RepID=A0A4Y2KVJ4_ARAVE|nr:hypothetical protein AVEN_193368-1 [Araneus ventricosus]